MPYSGASGYISLVLPSSSIEHIIPQDSTPRSLPFLILIPPGVIFPSWPPATRPPSRTTGTLSPSFTFGAPVTICTLSVPIFTWQMISLSASGCFSILSIWPITILSRSASSSVKPSTFVPVNVMASVYSCAVTSRSGTYVLIQDNEVFILVVPSFFYIYYKDLQLF